MVECGLSMCGAQGPDAYTEEGGGLEVKDREKKKYFNPPTPPPKKAELQFDLF